jgi:hypothetical protein
MPDLLTKPTLTKGRAMRFAYSESGSKAERMKRRRQVVEYVDEVIEGRIVSELLTGRRCYVLVIAPRPLSATAAESYAADCPGYVRGSCELLG